MCREGEETDEETADKIAKEEEPSRDEVGQTAAMRERIDSLLEENKKIREELRIIGYTYRIQSLWN